MKNMRCTECGIKKEACEAMYMDLLFASIAPHQVNFYKTLSVFVHFDLADKFQQVSKSQFST